MYNAGSHEAGAYVTQNITHNFPLVFNLTLTLTFVGLGSNPGHEAKAKIIECWMNIL